MRKLISSLILSLFFYVCQAQSDEDYNSTITQVIETFNNNDCQKLFDSFSPELQSSMTVENVNAIISNKITEKGVLSDYDIIDEEDHSKRYLIQTEKDSCVLEIGLRMDLKIIKFKIE